MRSGRIVELVLCAVTLVGSAGCGGGGGDGGGGSPVTPTAPGAPSNSVTVGASSFSPSTITVTKGATVRWTWNTCSGGDIYGGAQTCVAHNVTFDGTNASTTQERGSWSRVFSEAGTFDYKCTIHGATMSGRVVVQ